MKRQVSGAIVGLVMGVIGLTATTGADAANALPQASSASTGGRTSVPYGWVDFCNRYAGQCDGPDLPAVSVELTTRSFGEIERVDRQVNASVVAVTDMEHWGVVDRWDLPLDGRGDCEDFVLLKRKLLIDAGLPRQALLVTVVRDLQGEGHAVLTVKTTRGDFVLDNLNDKVRPWTETGYRFVKRQSQQDPNVWVSIGTPGGDPVVTARQ